MNYFVTHSNEAYLPTAKRLFRSLFRNSGCKIIYFTVNFSYHNFDHTNIIPYRLDIESDLKTKDFLTFIKPRIMQEAINKFGANNNYCYVDADNICLDNCDSVFDEAVDITDFPLAGRNAHDFMMIMRDGQSYGDPFAHGGYDLNLSIEADLLKLLDIDVNKRSNIYRQTNTVLFNGRCSDFLKEWDALCFKKEITDYPDKYAFFFDEPIYNALLWQKDIDKHLDHISINIPKPTTVSEFLDFIDAYNQPRSEAGRHGSLTYFPEPAKRNKIRFLHGGDLNDLKYELIEQEIFLHPKKLFNIKDAKNQRVDIDVFKGGAVNMQVFGHHTHGKDLLFENNIKLNSRSGIFFDGYSDVDFYNKTSVRITIGNEYDEQYFKTSSSEPLHIFDDKELRVLRNSPTFVFKEVFCDRFYDTPKIWEDLEVCLDIGANAGYFAFKAGMMGAGKIICVEPDPRLKRFSDILNKDYNIEYHNKAFYKTSGDKINLHLMSTRESGGQTIIDDFVPEESNETVECETISLHDLTKDLETVSVLKCDCEGAEIFLFEDENLEILRDKVKKLTLELHIPLDSDITYYKNTLEKIGFTCFFELKGEYQTKLYHLYAVNSKFDELKTVVYLVPHFSTGGMPEYVFNKVLDDIANGIDPYILEACYYGDKYVSQRNKAIEALGGAFVSAHGNPDDVLKWINKIKPDVIHLQEEPELFDHSMNSIWPVIFSQDRNYFVKTTSHTSTYTPTGKLKPNEYVFCCQHHFEVYKNVNISKSLWQYNPEKLTKNPQAWDNLQYHAGNKKHILQVGLFYECKNQKYTLELAKLLINEDYVFHFVGSQADNFKSYWEDIEFPENCVWWGERSDVENLYSIADLFIMPSKAELNPISIKEALSYDIDCLVSNLETIKNNNLLTTKFHFLTGNAEADAAKIKHIINKDLLYHVKFDSASLGDSIAWMGVVEKFRQETGAEVYCSTFNNDLFESSYDKIKFFPMDYSFTRPDVQEIKIGYYDKGQTDNPKTQPLQKIASDILGLEWNGHIQTTIGQHKPQTEKPYVCIAAQSTAQCKYWNNPEGWNTIIDYINKKGYDVYCIDLYGNFGNGDNFNNTPEKAIDWTGDQPLTERIQQLSGATCFVGLSSGLSWVSWATGVPTVLISGFTKEYNEFDTPYRVINKDVCNGCWNDAKEDFDKNNWMWCPRHKDFECSKQITPQMVIDQLDKIL